MKWIVLGLVAVVVAVAIAVAVVAERQLQPTVTRQLAQALQSDVSVGGARWLFPVGLRMEALTARHGQAEPWLSVSGITVRVAPWSLLLKRTVVADIAIDRPELVVNRRADGTLSLPVFAQSGSQVVPRRLNVQNGRVAFSDEQVSSPPLELQIRDLAVSTELVAAPGLRYLVTGVVEGRSAQQAGEFHVSGETTLEGRTSAVVKLTHRDLSQLSPYLKPAFGTEVTGGQAAITADVQGTPDQVEARVRAETTRLTLAPGTMTSLGIPAQQFIAALEDRTGRIQFEFTVSGPWDRLQVEWNQLMASALQQVVRSRLGETVKDVVAQGIAELTKPPAEGQPEQSFEDRVKNLGKQLERTLKQQLQEEKPDESPAPPKN